MSAEESSVPMDHARLRRLATYASVSVAVTLIVAKLAAYLMMDSVAVLSSLLDSTIDLLSSLVTVYGVASALRPPDREHRFGHGKAEPLAALAQAAFIVGSSILLGYEAIGRLYHPHDMQNPEMGYGVMALSIALTLVLVQFQAFVVRRTSSMAIHADRMHYVGDVAVNMAVVVAIALHQATGIGWFDPLFAILISGALSFTAVKIARQALRVLMDEELPDDDRAEIKDIVRRYPGVLGLHDMRTRSDSDRIFVELHVEMDPAITLAAAHEISEGLMAAVRHRFPDADVLIHQDPAGHEEHRLDQRIG